MNKLNRKIIHLQARALDKSLKFSIRDKFLDQGDRHTDPADFEEYRKVFRLNNRETSDIPRLASLSDNQKARLVRLMLGHELSNCGYVFPDSGLCFGFLHETGYNQYRHDPSWAFWHHSATFDVTQRLGRIARYRAVG